MRHQKGLLHKRGIDLLVLDKAYYSSKTADRRMEGIVSMI